MIAKSSAMSHIDPDYISEVYERLREATDAHAIQAWAVRDAKQALEVSKAYILVEDVRLKAEGKEVRLNGSNETLRKAQLDNLAASEAEALRLAEAELQSAKHNLDMVRIDVEEIDVLLRNIGR